jgi:hypothetical protein
VLIRAAIGGYLKAMESSASCRTDRMATVSAHREKLSLPLDVIDAVIAGSRQACSAARHISSTAAQRAALQRRRDDEQLDMADE